MARSSVLLILVLDGHYVDTVVVTQDVIGIEEQLRKFPSLNCFL